MISRSVARHAPGASVFVALLIARSLFAAENLSPLGKSPDWQYLERYQETITHDEFQRLIETVYCTHGVSEQLLRIRADSAQVLMNADAQTWFTLRFAKDAESRKRVARYWRKARDLPAPKRARTLSSLKIAIDPGHLGGKWARMEERWFKVGDQQPVQEGDMTLRVAKILLPQLRALGARPMLVRAKLDPVTPKRPDDLRELARQILVKSGTSEPPENFSGPDDPQKEQSVRWESEILFYRNSEIRERAELVNSSLRPDLVLCLHFNAEPWGEPETPTLVDKNHFHLLVNGAYLESELQFDDERFDMLRRLLLRTFDEEAPLADALALSLHKQTQLPAYQYTTGNVTPIGTTGYVYARNLLANRLYRCPVIYFEPYVMNGNDAFARIEAGDYEGLRSVNGIERPSIFREYADGVLDGLIDYYHAAREIDR